MKKYNVLWFGPVAEPSGYGVASRNYLRQLVRYPEIQLKLVNRYFWAGERLDLGSDQELFEELSDVELLKGLKTLAVFHLTPDHYKIYKGIDKQVCMTTFETNSLPEKWLMPIRSMDEVWTYTQFNKETFTYAGVNNDIHIIPHGVDIMKYNPLVKPLGEVKEVTKSKFVFGSVFDWHSRKNPEVLVEAFLRAFKDGNDVDKVCLLLKTFYTWSKDGDKYIKDRINEIKSKVGGNLPSVYLMPSIVDDKDMPSFYKCFDCYITPSRGEGWNLPASESMAMELPVIATNWGGNTEFMTKDNSYLLPYQLVNIDENEAKHHPYFKNQKWADIALKDVIDAIRNVYYNRDEAIKKGKQARVDMQKLSWDNAGKILFENIERILS